MAMIAVGVGHCLAPANFIIEYGHRKIESKSINCMNKIFAVLLLMSSVMMVGCDRATLDGLNLKINTEIKSDYNEQKNQNKEDQERGNKENETSETESSQPPSENNATATIDKNQESASESQTKETAETQTAQQNNTAENDPDAPMPFKEIPECSKAGITAKTNEIFYADNPQVKSIDSKNQKQVKEWKRIYAQVEQECNKQN